MTTTDFDQYDDLVVLIADDDRDCQQLIGSVIHSLGASVVYASDGEEAWELYQQVSPDLAILDFTMPGLVGTEVSDRIRQSDAGSYVGVLMVTARDDMDGRVAALEGGVDDYLEKPFHIKELRARVRALLRNRKLTRALQRKSEDLIALQQKLISQERQLVVQQLSGTAAHQLNQPLSALLLSIYTLKDVEVSDSIKQEILEQMHNDLQRMTSIIERLQAVRSDEILDYHDDVHILGIDDSSDDSAT